MRERRIGDATASQGITEAADGTKTLTIAGGATTSDPSTYPAWAAWPLLGVSGEHLDWSDTTEFLHSQIGKMIVAGHAGASSGAIYGIGVANTADKATATGVFIAFERTGGGFSKLTAGKWAAGSTTGGATSAAATSAVDTLLGAHILASLTTTAAGTVQARAYLSSAPTTVVKQQTGFPNQAITGPLYFVLFGGRVDATAGTETPTLNVAQSPAMLVDPSEGV